MTCPFNNIQAIKLMTELKVGGCWFGSHYIDRISGILKLQNYMTLPYYKTERQ